MMDLVILGIFAFWVGRNFDGFDFDFSQNQDNGGENPPETIPANFTDWIKIKEQNDRFGDPCSIWEREYKQGDVVIWKQYQIRRNNQVVRSGYRSEEEVLIAFTNVVRPFREGELEEMEEKQREKEEANQPQEEEREPAQPLTFEDYQKTRSGVF